MYHEADDEYDEERATYLSFNDYSCVKKASEKANYEFLQKNQTGFS